MKLFYIIYENKMETYNADWNWLLFVFDMSHK